MLRGIHVLVAEDHEVNREQIRDQLDELVYMSYIVENGLIPPASAGQTRATPETKNPRSLVLSRVSGLLRNCLENSLVGGTGIEPVTPAV
jgi:hypothetical protein